MRVCPSVRRFVRPWSVSRYFNCGIEAEKGSHFHQCTCPTYATDADVYTNLFPSSFPFSPSAKYLQTSFKLTVRHQGHPGTPWMSLPVRPCPVQATNVVVCTALFPSRSIVAMLAWIPNLLLADAWHSCVKTFHCRD